MVEPVTAVLTGIALVKKSVDFIKSNISTAQDIGDIIGHVDKALNGQQEVIKARDKANVDHFAVPLPCAPSIILPRLVFPAPSKLA